MGPVPEMVSMDSKSFVSGQSRLLGDQENCKVSMNHCTPGFAVFLAWGLVAGGERHTICMVSRASHYSGCGGAP